MPTFAAVDIGANSVRLKVARLVRQRLQTLYEDREVVRLGESVFQRELLAPAAMAHTVKVLRRFHRSVQRHGDVQVRVVATSALRDARNARAFIDWVQMRTGWRVEVISGIEEARLIHFGIITNLRLSTSPLLLIDLGGGSCELTVSVRHHIRETVSLPLGAVRLTQDFMHHDPPRDYELHRLRSYIAEEVGRVQRKIAAAKVQSVIATSGTAAALAMGAKSLIKTGRSNAVPTRAVVRLAEKLAEMSYAQRISIPGIGTRRGEIIIAGATAYAELLERCELRGIRYSDLGLRDGVLAQMAAEYTHTSQRTRQLESERWDALLAMAKRYRVNLEQAQHVRSLAMQLFKALRSVHRMPPEYEEWLSAASILHEIGAYVNRTGWHRHAYYLISNSDILGYTPKQRQVMAAITRYLGSALPTPNDKMMRSLDTLDRENVPKAVALLRLARALNQGRRRVVSNVKVHSRDGRIVIRLLGRSAKRADLEMWALKRERAFFRAVFGRELVGEL